MIKIVLQDLFLKLDNYISKANLERKKEGLRLIEKTEIKILGQMSLLANETVSPLLALAQTADLDAWVVMEDTVKQELRRLLKQQGLIYDEDSHLIWIPKDSSFENFCNHKNVDTRIIDAESALVSKAVRAPEKNKQLIRQAIASSHFPTLVDRILQNGGRLEDFI